MKLSVLFVAALGSLAFLTLGAEGQGQGDVFAINEIEKQKIAEEDSTFWTRTLQQSAEPPPPNQGGPTREERQAAKRARKAAKAAAKAEKARQKAIKKARKRAKKAAKRARKRAKRQRQKQQAQPPPPVGKSGKKGGSYGNWKGRYDYRVLEAKGKAAPWHNQPETSSDPPRVFALESSAMATQAYGVRLPPEQMAEEEEVKATLTNDICDKEYFGVSTPQCENQLEVMKCTTCSAQDGMWYSAVSRAGSSSGHLTDDFSVKVSSATAAVYHQIDVAVPLMGEADKLRLFAARLGETIRKFRQDSFTGSRDMRFRLLVTKFEEDNYGELSNVKEELSNLASLSSTDNVVFVEVTPSKETTSDIVFNRAQAVNTLMTKVSSQDDCLVLVMDVDMEVSTSFLRNSMSFVKARTSAYFPIVWSTYNPETIALVEDFLRPKDSEDYKLPKFSNHMGVWRSYGFGIYALAGSDAVQYTMNESFIGWGGEDNDFFHFVRERLNIIRMQEHGLVHLWHPKTCNLGSFVEESKRASCVGSLASVEGSNLGMYLREQKARTSSPLPTKNPSSKVLITVTTSRKSFVTRVGAIAKTWGKNLPENVEVRFFVGVDDSDLYVSDLAKKAGLKDSSSIEVLGVKDDEYPPVRKNAEMLKRADRMVEESKKSGNPIQWVFKVDDDTHVNVDQLQAFLKERDPSKAQLYGSRGFGRKQDQEGLLKAGLTKPFCMGGPGYIMSHAALHETAPGFDSCIAKYDAEPDDVRKYVWHSDVIIGICFNRKSGLGCWDGDGSKYPGSAVFRHIYKGSAMDLFNKKQALGAVSVHPFKQKDLMEVFHAEIDASAV